jgi:hypothetical protein
VKFGGNIDKFGDRFLLPAQLDKIDISFDHRFDNAPRIGHCDVVEIDDAIKPAIS